MLGFLFVLLCPKIKDFANIAKVAGEGEGTDRQIVTVGSAAGLDRNEIFVDARDLSSGEYENAEQYIDREKEAIPFIRTSDIVNNEVDLYPDYYISLEALTEINQDVQPKDVILTKDGKVGSVGMITDEDNVILSSGIERLRLTEDAKKSGFTPEYLFIALSTKEIGYYAAIRRTVVASTIPHLREDRLKDIEIPIEDPDSVSKITKLVEEAFKLKADRKKIIKESDTLMANYFES